MQDLRLEGKYVYLCSFDISSQFTNVPIKETIGICAEALYKDPSSAPPIPKMVFIELMESALSSLEFNFNDTMYKQMDRVAMGSPLGPALANIFVGYRESKLFTCVQKLTIIFNMLTTPLPSLNKRVTLTISWSRLIVYILLSSSRLKKNTMANFHF